MTRTARLITSLLHFQSRKVQAYGLGFALFAIAALFRKLADPYLPDGFPYLTFFPSIIITAFLCGFGPGLAVSILSGIVAWYYYIPPFYSFQLTPTTAVALLFFVGIVAVNLFIIEALTRSLVDLNAERHRSRRFAEQRDTLFREVQHRIGNNLQAISALLSIQSRTVSDPAAKLALQQSTQRIGTIADIQRLFHDPNRAEGLLDEMFVSELVQKCLNAAGMEGQVTVETAIEPVLLQQDAFMPVALILTECVNNAIEHAFQAQSAQRLNVELKVHQTSKQVHLVVADDGDGPPDGFDPARASSIGMRVIGAFTKQINGTFSVKKENGTRCELSFPAQ